MPIFARSSSTHAGTTLRSFWTSTLPLDTLFGIASGTGVVVMSVKRTVSTALLEACS